MVRLVATDLDGTLLDPTGRISDSDAAAVLEAAAAGVLIVVATGRPVRWLGCLSAIKDAHPFVIVSNGAAVYDLLEERVVRTHPLAPALLAELAAELREAIPGLVLAVEHGDHFGCEPEWFSAGPDRTRTASEEDAVTLRAPWGDLLAVEADVVKLLGLHAGYSPDDLLERAVAVVGDRAVVTHSVATGHALLEITAPGITKAHTLAAFCAEHGVDAADVAAFGDMPNDLEMLTFAGRPFVMANGHASLRERFPVIGSNADGGVGRQLRTLLRGE